MLIAIEKHSTATYSMSGTNQLCSNDQYINSEIECKKAAKSLGKTFKDSRSRWGMPKGCYFHQYNGNIYFNTYSYGKKSNAAVQICKDERLKGIY